MYQPLLAHALDIAVRDALDLEHGAIRLDKNKTDDPRAWALNPAVSLALRVYLKAFRPNAEATSPLFVDEHGRPFTREGLAEQLRLDLEATGLKAKRPELFETSEQRMRIRVHDLRDVFVTVNLANGRSEAWISDRTGHRSSQMINRYRRLARTFEELNLGELALLDDALPEPKAAKPSVLLQAEMGREAGQVASAASDAVLASSEISAVGHSGLEPEANGLRAANGGTARTSRDCAVAGSKSASEVRGRSGQKRTAGAHLDAAHSRHLEFGD